MNYKLFLTFKNYKNVITNTIVYNLPLTMNNNKIVKYNIKKVKDIKSELDEYGSIDEKIEKRNKYKTELLLDVEIIASEITNIFIPAGINAFDYYNIKINNDYVDLLKNNIDIITEIINKLFKKNQINFIDEYHYDITEEKKKEGIKEILKDELLK